MKVKMLVSIASADWSYSPGEIVELSDDKAAVWAKIGHCEILEKTTQKRGGKNVNHRK